MGIRRLVYWWNIIKHISIFRKDEDQQKKCDADWRQSQRIDYIIQEYHTVVWQICSKISEKCALSPFRVVTSNLIHLSGLNILIELLLIIHFVVRFHNVHIRLLILQFEWILPIFKRIQTFTSKRTNHDRIVFIPKEVLAGSVT